MRILIFGATGLLGKALMHEPLHVVVGLGSKDADIRSTAEIRHAVAQHRPDWIVLAAAYTDVDGCEKNASLAWEVNCNGAVNVAGVAKEFSVPLIFLSTDYVFDGEKTTPYEVSDARAPQSVYGKTKAAAEERILNLMQQVCVLRTSWVFGAGGRCFPQTILQLAATRSELEVVDDQRGSPTYTHDLAKAIYQLAEGRAHGIVHATNSGDCTWFEFAREILRESAPNVSVRSTTSENFVRPAKRPKYSVLSGTSLAAMGITMPTWQDAVQRYLSEIGRLHASQPGIAGNQEK